MRIPIIAASAQLLFLAACGEATAPEYLLADGTYELSLSEPSVVERCCLLAGASVEDWMTTEPVIRFSKVGAEVTVLGSEGFELSASAEAAYTEFLESSEWTVRFDPGLGGTRFWSATGNAAGCREAAAVKTVEASCWLGSSSCGYNSTIVALRCQLTPTA